VSDSEVKWHGVGMTWAKDCSYSPRMVRALVILGASMFLFTGCAVVRAPPGTTGTNKAALKSNEKQCKPSQTWDGKQCRHKGKGHGARKHDD
jgi:hypothetical protein